MKKLLLITAILVSIITFASDEDKFKGFTKQEIRYIKNVEIVQQEHITSITRTEDKNILVVFPTARYLLGADGFAINVWMLADDEKSWDEMGPEY